MNENSMYMGKEEFKDKIKDICSLFDIPMMDDKKLTQWWERVSFAKETLLRMGIEIIPQFLPENVDKFKLSPMGILSLCAKVIAVNEWSFAREYADGNRKGEILCSDKTKSIIDTLGGWDAIKKDSPNLSSNYWIFMDMWNFI